MQQHMQNLMWVASVFGPLMVINGLWMLFYHENMNKILTSVKNTPAIFHCNALISLFLGLVIVNQYNVWVWTLSILVTLLGWCLIVRGVLALFVPQMFVKIMMGKAANVKTWAAITFIWGLLLCRLAFWM